MRRLTFWSFGLGSRAVGDLFDEPDTLMRRGALLVAYRLVDDPGATKLLWFLPSNAPWPASAWPSAQAWRLRPWPAEVETDLKLFQVVHDPQTP